VIYIFVQYLKKPNTVEFRIISGFYGEEKNSLDVVYLGGSACFVYWEPLKAWEESGIPSYNFASNTIQAELYEYLIKETLKYQEPKVIIIDARAFQYRDIDQPPTEMAYRNVLTGTPFSVERFNFIEKNVPKYLKEKTLSYHLDLIKYHGSKSRNSITNTLKILSKNYKNELKGFYFVPKSEEIKKEDFKTKVETPISENTNEILKNLLTYLKSINTKILFVVSPYSETKSHKENFNYIERKIKDAGFDFLDSNEYYKEMDLNFNTDFYNSNHVNIYGADKYTEFLQNFLKNKYDLLDRRKDKNFSKNWNVLLNNWHTQVNNTKTEINNILERCNYEFCIK